MLSESRGSIAPNDIVDFIEQFAKTLKESFKLNDLTKILLLTSRYAVFRGYI